MRFALPYLLVLLLTTAAILASGCRVGYPFRGPGFDPERGVTIVGPDATVVVAITHGTMDSGRGRAFSEQLELVLDSLTAREGLVGFAVRKELLGREVWTLSAWTDERALDAFTYSPAHRAAVRNGGIRPKAVRSALVELPARELPLDWKRAEGFLDEQAPR